jgi:hypothetical protein
MSDINFSEMIKMDEKELNSIKKDVIVKTILNYKWLYEANEEEVKTLKKDVKNNADEASRCCVMISSFLGDEMDIKSNYYSNNPEVKMGNTSLTILVSRLMSIADASKATPMKLVKKEC